MTPLLPPPLQIGRHRIATPLLLAPMAGVTDRCFRVLCRRMGAGLCVGEMTHASQALRDTWKSRARLDHSGEPEPVAVQIAGADPRELARAAQHNRAQGAQIIDINMGCPAKKVCRRDAGSALLADERRVAAILRAVVRAVDVPVTLKIRTGVHPQARNAVRIARIAEDAGIALLSIHGRTRADAFRGTAEFETIARVKQAVRLPVIANGDIGDAEAAAAVLRATGADGLMIGRAAQGRPWIFRELAAALSGQPVPPPPTPAEIRALLLEHLDGIYALYGEGRGVRIARKHIQWYCNEQPGGAQFWRRICRVDTAGAQRAAVAEAFGDQRLAA